MYMNGSKHLQFASFILGVLQKQTQTGGSGSKMMASNLNEVEQDGAEAGRMEHLQAIPHHTEDWERAIYRL